MLSASQTTPASSPPDEAFFASYDWCLNPILSVRDLLQRIREEVRRHSSLEIDWQREESRINLYLFLCAACCTTDDYLAFRPWQFAAIVRRFPRLKHILALAESLLNGPYALRLVWGRRRVRRWRRVVCGCVDRICEILTSGSEPGAKRWEELLSDLQTLASVPPPPRLLGWRMRIPEGFRCQDLSHHDVLAMAQRLASSCTPDQGPFLIVGPRTAGAYFAPLVKAYFQAQGISVLGWMTFRPKQGASREEKRRFRKLVAGAPRVVVVDDHPNTGRTLTLMTALIRRLGIHRDKIVVLAPKHPAQPDWTQAVRPVAVVSLPSTATYKQKLLDDQAAIASILRQLYLDRGCEDVSVQPSATVEAVNSRLWSHYADGFQVRLKRVFEVRLSRYDRPPVIQHVFAKSVGWGWLGYHSYIAGRRLAGFVPTVIGLRQGLLFAEWVGNPGTGEAPPDHERVVSALPRYLAARTRLLRLSEDPCRSAGYRWTGRDSLVQLLRRPYGPFVGRLKTGVVRAQLAQYSNRLPTLLDGRMRPEEWITEGTEVYKTDFEQHNFGGGEQDLVDPAYDLACAIYELGLSKDEEWEVLRTYVQQSGDGSIHDRLLLYKLLCGALVMKTAAYRLARNSSREVQEKWNWRYVSGRNFLIYQMNRHVASRLAGLGPPSWSQHLFFLDLDGVFDWDFFAFPHTTPSGVLALRLLKSHGHSVVLNTGRSIEHVREYCASYGLAGGVAEYGSVFVDAVRQLELPLVDEEARQQLDRCRELIQKMPNVFIDPGYQWSVRAYRYDGQTTVSLERPELEGLLNAARLDKLRFIWGPGDCYIVQKDLNKGTGLLAVKQYVAGVQHPIIAMGDSAQDLEMLEQADIAYLPGNCNQALRRLAGPPKYRLMRQPLQRGLLEAVQHLLRDYSARDKAPPLSKHLVDALLEVAERPRIEQLLGALNHRQV